MRQVEAQLLWQMGDAEEDGDGAPDQGSAEDAQADACYHIFEHRRDGGDHRSGCLSETIGEPDGDVL